MSVEVTVGGVSLEPLARFQKAAPRTVLVPLVPTLAWAISVQPLMPVKAPPAASSLERKASRTSSAWCAGRLRTSESASATWMVVATSTR